MNVQRTFDLLGRLESISPGQTVLSVKHKGQWTGHTSEEYSRLSGLFSMGLLCLGFRKGDKILTVCQNRPEWNIVDMGMAMLGVVHVPVFTSLNREEYRHILRHSDVRMVIAGDAGLLAKLSLANDNPDLEKDFYCFDEVEGQRYWKEILELGEKNEEKYREELNVIKKDILPDDPATLIYTSGTTGTPKGVVLSHKNLVQNFTAASEVFRLGPGDRYLSILPLCHVGGRMGNYQTQYSGSSIYYAESLGTIAANMKEIRADGFDAVPRILEKIIDTVIAKGNKLGGLKKKIFFWAVRLGFRYSLPEESSLWYRLKLHLADQLIFSKWREALGGRIRLVGCGGASLQPRIERIFWAAGIKVINMYGLTETSPVITINRQEKPLLKLGTVGALIDGVEVKIAGDGEVLCKGHNVMIGYYKDPELTRKAFDEEGWFRTGDIGSMVDGTFLKITDRKKEIFKLTNGKFIAPQIIENRLREFALVDQAMVVGENEKFASALISPNFVALEEWCAGENLNFSDRDNMIRSARVIAMFNETIGRMNKELSGPENISRFRLVSDEWSPAGGELSPTLKLKRSFIAARYADLLREIYQKSAE